MEEETVQIWSVSIGILVNLLTKTVITEYKWLLSCSSNCNFVSKSAVQPGVCSNFVQVAIELFSSD